MRIPRTTRMIVSASALLLLFASAESARAKERIGSASASTVHALPSFDALIAALQTPAPASRPSKSSTVPLPPGEGLETVKKACSMCHGTDTFARQRHTRDKWNGIIDNMVSKGMEASEDDLDKMADYLGANLGPDSPPPPAGQAPASLPGPKPSPQSSK